jgi:hypothetical protein
VSNTSSITKDLPSDPNIITPAIRATLPAFQYVSERERAPEPTIPESEAADPDSHSETEIVTLQPRTYSPIPSSAIQRPTELYVPPPSKIPPTTSGKKRFSLKRKAPPEKKTTLKSSTPPSSHPQTIMEVRSSPQLRVTPDSAYGSDTDKIAYQSNTASGYFDLKPSFSHDHPASDYARSPGSPKAQQILGTSFVASPRSDQQHFHPVKASPNSPLQRPWTAAGTTNLRSNTSMSKMSQVTTATEDGTRVKKKKSGFGWLKKAFSLDEEERKIFEEKRKAPPPTRQYAGDRKPQFLDGRRIR